MPFHVYQTVPVLRIFDEAKAREFYVDYLGFTIDWEHRFEPGLPLYAQVARDGCTLHLSGHHGDACPGTAVLVRVTGLDDFHAELTAKNDPHLRPGVEDMPWGARVMEIPDPFGTRLRFQESRVEAEAEAEPEAESEPGSA